MVKPGKLLPPDPRPWTADPECRKQRKEFEKEAGGFDWGQALALGLIGATVVFGIDKSLRRTEEKHEEEDRREERRRQRESQSRSSRARRSSQSQAGYGRDRHDRDERDDDVDREYYDRYYDEREAIRAARDYSREPARAPESIRSLRDDRAEYERSEYVRAVDQFDRDYGYGRRYYEEHKRSQSNPAARSRNSNW